jgi:VIT1/CCC1 family predicted Fe2+/Mn2+ transporter
LSVDPVAEQVELAVSVQSGTARAAVLGINDGLVTNIALILGVAGASADPSVVRLAGLASLVAGACSMAVGEYISMRAQVEFAGAAAQRGARGHRAKPRSAGRDPA